MQIGGLHVRRLFVLVDQSAEDVCAAYSALLGEVDDLGGWAWWREVEAGVRTLFAASLECKAVVVAGPGPSRSA
jgi:hypothetical protein